MIQGLAGVLVTWLAGIEIDAPEMRSGREKLHPHADAALAGIAQIHDPAFLFFLRFRAYQHQDLSMHHFVPKDDQSAVRAHHQRLADLAKLPAILAAPERLQLGLVKHPLAAPLAGFDEFCHAPIIGLYPKTGQLPQRTGVPQPLSPSPTCDSPLAVLEWFDSNFGDLRFTSAVIPFVFSRKSLRPFAETEP